MPKLANSNSAENTWENSPSSQSSAEWHIPTSNSSSASECAGESEAPETTPAAVQNNVLSNSESSNCSLSRTSFNEGKEIQLPKTLQNDVNDKPIVETADANDIDSSTGKEDSSVDKVENNSSIDSKPKVENSNEDNKNIISPTSEAAKVLENSDKPSEGADIPENSPLSDEFWKKQNPLVDHVLITDVTTNLLTVTVRECDTSSGFFKDRPNAEKESTPKEKEENSL